ncbi:hypothetical protein IKF23_00860 [Candidatus Saccharibacteria bacterium]|nr:hypothetical protein [Candidatus Saccharibacteria bacterium]
MLSNSASATTIPTTVNIKPSLGMTIPTDSVVLNLDPTTNPFDNETVTISVGTNNPTGYWLTMSTANSSTDLVNTADNTKTIPTLTSSISESDFPVNKWGYRLDSGNYLPYTSGTVINSKSTKVNNDTTDVTIASKIDYLEVPGIYQQTFSFQALPHVTNYYMQDLDDATLANQVCVKDAPSIVIDNRDEQAYMIQRLDDDKCWMLDNLNLDLTNKTIVDNLTTANTNADADSLRSLKEGYRSQCILDGGTNCNRYATSGLTLSNWSTGASYTSPLINKGSSCSVEYEYPCSYTGNYTNNTVLSTLTPEQSTFGLGSGKIGIYYNFCAASAGSYCYNSNVSIDANAEYDICPNSWKLPTAAKDGDFQLLCNSVYGGTCSNSGTTMDATDHTSLQYKLSTLLSGYYYNNHAWRQGIYGTFWSSTYRDSSTMYELYIDSVIVHPFNSYDRTGGRSVRCLLNETQS